MSLAPRIEGTLSIRSSADQFLRRFRQRVESGPLPGLAASRSNYTVVFESPRLLRVRAADWWTAINVGLNDVILRGDDGRVRYEVKYWRWAGYVLGVAGFLGAVGLVMLLTLDARGYIAREPPARLPGLSVEQNLLVAWAMVLFWGFVWPWLLIAMHKRPLARLVARIVADIDASVTDRR